MFTQRTSIHGRRLGLSSTGGIITGVDSTGGGSTAFVLAAQMWGSAMLNTVSSSEATLRNAGVNLISTATSTAYTFTVGAPVAGVAMEVISRSSATTVTFQTSATTILFFDSTLTPDGATGLVLSQTSTDGGNFGAAVMLRGLSTARWQVLNKPRASTAAL